MMNCNVTKEFLLAGKAIFTVSKDGGDHYTFKITKRVFGETGNDVKWFVSLLTGPDNTSSYTYLGMVGGGWGDGPYELVLTSKSKLLPTSIPVKTINWVFKRVHDHNLPQGWYIRHEGKCGKCGRKLTVPESIERGIGPECAAYVGG